MIPSLLSDSEKSKNKGTSPTIEIHDKSLDNYFSAFPEESKVRQAIESAFVINRPMSGVGGDGYWIHEDSGIIFLVVFDCMGHGRLASMMTRIYLNAIKCSIVEKRLHDPADALTHIHADLETRFRHKEKKLVGSGADMGILKYDTNIRKLEFGGAKMDLIKVLDGEVNKIKADKMQLGEMFEFPHNYTTKEIELLEDRKTNFYLFSDGVTDLIGGPDNKRLKMGNFKKMLEEVYVLSMDDQKMELDKRFDDWAGMNLQTDDLLLVGIAL